MRGAEEADQLTPVTEQLLGDGVIEPLGDDEDDVRRWLDAELCTYVEHRFGETLDPVAVTSEARQRWSRRALAPDERLVDPRLGEWRTAFWLLERGERVGTIALGSMLGRLMVPVSSLYVFPARRSTGIAYRSLRSLQDAAVAAGHQGVRIGTHWTWQAAVRRYLLRYRMWACSFKHSIDFTWGANLPPHVILVDERRARFAVEQGGDTIELLAAARDGDRLVWTDHTKRAGVDDDVRFFARSTFAVALAVHGWPLLQTPDELADAAGWDVGGPDVLARKIAIFEWLDRKQGFAVETPRIPGLSYEVVTRALEEG